MLREGRHHNIERYLLQARYSCWECYEFLCYILSPFSLWDDVIFNLRRGSCPFCSSLLPSLSLQFLMLPYTPFTPTTLWVFLFYLHTWCYLIIGAITTTLHIIIQPHHLFIACTVIGAPKVVIHSLSTQINNSSIKTKAIYGHISNRLATSMKVWRNNMLWNDKWLPNERASSAMSPPSCGCVFSWCFKN